MSWLRDIFSRAPRAAVGPVSTDYGQTIQQLVQADDSAMRAHLGAQLARQLQTAFSRSADNTQVAIWQLSEQLRQGQGETNDMIGEAVSLIREQGAAVDALRADFRETAETVSELQLWRVGVDQTLASFTQSRDESRRERAQHTADLGESKQHRAALQQRLDTELPLIFQQLMELSTQVEQLSGQIAQLLAARRVGDGSPQD